MQNIIEVKNLQKSFKNNHVLKGVSFEIKKGSIFALLGSNGAGKTTCVRILATLSNLDGGEARICGHDVVKQAEKVREVISLTGQFAAVDEILTGRENLKIIADLRRLKDPKARAAQMLEQFGLTDAADRPASTYSGGMRRRLDIAMSLMVNPEVVFLDEPTTGLDPQNRIAMWEKMKDLAKNGTTVFLTTQYLEEAEQLADHIAILHEGVITAEGTPGHLKSIMPYRGATLDFATVAEAERARKVLAEAGINIAGITEKTPSLEDVFLTLIGEKS